MSNLEKALYDRIDSISFTYNEFGVLDKAVVVSRDITSTKDLEEKLHYVFKRKKEIAQQLIEEKEKNKEELCNELHDGINKLLIATKLSIQNSGLKNKLLDYNHDKLQLAIEHIRKMSLKSTTQFVLNENLIRTITDYVLCFNSELTTKIRIDNEPQDTLKVNSNSKNQIFRIILQLAHFRINTSKSINCINNFKQIKNDFVEVVVDNGFFIFDFSSWNYDLKSIQDQIYLFKRNYVFSIFLISALQVQIKIKLNEY
jgi:signal transduction histidine kinase